MARLCLLKKEIFVDLRASVLEGLGQGGAGHPRTQEECLCRDFYMCLLLTRTGRVAGLS